MLKQTEYHIPILDVLKHVNTHYTQQAEYIKNTNRNRWGPLPAIPNVAEYRNNWRIPIPDAHSAHP